MISFQYEEPYYIADDNSPPAKTLLDGLPDCAPSDHQKLLYDFHTQLRRDKLSVADWQKHVATIRESPGFEVIKASLLSGRTVAKPRGYAGDAVMIDSIYGIGTTESISEAGQRTYEWELTSAACRSVRARRHYLADIIDKVPLDGRILSVACGHLREAELCSTLNARAAESLIGFDQDAESIDVLRASAVPCVKPIVGSVKQLLFNSVELGGFDLIYSAGLFDYLNDKVAKALVRKLIAMLRPGGTLHIANFTPELPDIPYMEAVMDWWLIYRDVENMLGLVAAAEAVTATASYMSVPNCLNAVAWLRVEKPL